MHCIWQDFNQKQLIKSSSALICYFTFYQGRNYFFTVCPRSLDPFHIVTYNIKGVKTSWTYSSKKIQMRRRKTYLTNSTESMLSELVICGGVLLPQYLPINPPNNISRQCFWSKEWSRYRGLICILLISSIPKKKRLDRRVLFPRSFPINPSKKLHWSTKGGKQGGQCKYS